MYNTHEIVNTYGNVGDVLLIRHIIREYSTNKNDVRDVALHGLDLRHCTHVLELGCGYGFFIEKLQGRLHRDATVIGIDMVENNREPFIHTVLSLSYKGEFIAGDASIISQMRASTFDLVIASYSLYFFPNLIPEIARVMRTNAVFVAVTHSRRTLDVLIELVTSCLRYKGMSLSSPIAFNKLFESFSAEEGGEILRLYFEVVETIPYRNAMVFPYTHVDDCILYVRQKRNLVYKEVLSHMPEKLEEIEECVAQAIRTYAHNKGSIVLNKDDAVFRCYRPREAGERHR